MRKDLLQKESASSCSKSSRNRRQKNKDPASENRPQRTHDDLMKYGKAEKCSWYRFKHYRSNNTTMKLIKYKTLCGNLSTQEGRWTITTLI
jgi:hypothetical protein